MRKFFARLEEKHNVLEILRKFSKYLFIKLRKCIILTYFPKKINKPCVNFLGVWMKNSNCWEILKISDENSIEKLTFYFGNLLLKIEPSEITPFFKKKFRLGGGNFPPFPLPLATPLQLECRF